MPTATAATTLTPPQIVLCELDRPSLPGLESYSPYCLKVHRALKARDQLRTWVSAAVECHTPGSAEHLLDRMLRAHTPDGKTLSKEVVKIELVHFFFAGFGGLQAAMVHALKTLAEENEVARRVKEEARGAAPTGELGASLSKLEFTGRVSREIRRLNAIVPITQFGTMLTDDSLDGYRIPKGWKCAAALHATLRNEKVFLEPARFDADRFLRGEGGDNAYVPHGGAGPHRCVGESFTDAMLTAFVALVGREHRI